MNSIRSHEVKTITYLRVDVRKCLSSCRRGHQMNNHKRIKSVVLWEVLSRYGTESETELQRLQRAELAYPKREIIKKCLA